MPRPSTLAGGLALAVLCLLLATGAAAAQANPYRDLLTRADALVTVKFVLKVKMDGGADSESEGEITCPLIDPEGLVLCSNTDLGGYITVMSRLVGRGPLVSAMPTELEVFLPGQTQALEARLLTRDTDRDLAWIRIEEPPGAPLPHLDFGDSADVDVGERIYYLRQLHKFFGSREVVSEAVVGAVVQKPRRLLVPAVPVLPGFGVPVFTAGGKLVGLTVLQIPNAEDAAGFAGGTLSAFGTSVDVQDMIGGLVLPAAEVVKATELARELLAEEEALEDEPSGQPR